MPSKNKAGCTCCAPSDCEILADGFDRDDSDTLGGTWTETSGDIDIAGNLAVVASGVTGRAISSTTHTGNIRVTMDILAGGLGTRFRIILGYTDANNFIFADVLVNGASSSIRLWQRDAGTESDLGNVSLSLSSGVTYEFFACYKSRVFVAGITGSSSVAGSVDVFFTFGTQFGFQVQAVFGDASVNDFLARKVEEGCDDCVAPDVDVECENCIDDVLPKYFLVELDGFADDACTECELWNAAYIVGVGAGGTCSGVWIRGFLQSPCGNDIGGSGGFGTAPQITITFEPGVIRVVAALANPTPPVCRVAEFERSMGSDPFDCESISGLDIPLIATAVNCGEASPICDTSGATCTITAL